MRLRLFSRSPPQPLFSLQMENISSFLSALPGFGLRPEDVFQTSDLFEGVNMAAVRSPKCHQPSQSPMRRPTAASSLSCTPLPPRQVQMCLENVRRIADMKAKVSLSRLLHSRLFPFCLVRGPWPTARREIDPIYWGAPSCATSRASRLRPTRPLGRRSALARQSPRGSPPRRPRRPLPAAGQQSPQRT